MRPRDCKTYDDVAAMRTDNAPRKSNVWSILNGDDHISLHPPAGPDSGTYVTIPRDQFNKIVDWYNRHQKPKK